MDTRFKYVPIRHLGRIEIKDRLKDIIISGGITYFQINNIDLTFIGENICSIEVENIMLFHPNISEVAVIAMPDEKWGEVRRVATLHTLHTINPYNTCIHVIF